MLLFWVGVAVLIMWAVRNGGNSAGRDRPDRALEVLKERYARGEIDDDEFRSRRSELERL